MANGFNHFLFQSIFQKYQVIQAPNQHLDELDLHVLLQSTVHTESISLLEPHFPTHIVYQCLKDHFPRH
jgi:hypothetical protein